MGYAKLKEEWKSDYKDTESDISSELQSIENQERENELKIKAALTKIINLEELNIKAEDNLEALYNIDFEFQTDPAKKTYQDWLEMEKYELKELNDIVSILKAQNKELREKKTAYIKQETELKAEYLQDPDIFTKSEYGEFLEGKGISSVKDEWTEPLLREAYEINMPKDSDPRMPYDNWVDMAKVSWKTPSEFHDEDFKEKYNWFGKYDDKDIAGYEKGYTDYLSSDIPAKTWRLDQSKKAIKEQDLNKARLRSQQKLNTYAYSAKLSSGYGDISSLQYTIAALKEDANFTEEDEVYLEKVTKLDTLITTLGTQFGALFTDIESAKQNSDIWYEKFYEMQLKASDKDLRDFTDVYYFARDAFHRYQGLSEKDKKMHDALGQKFFGYNKKQFENFEDFFMSFAKDYSLDAFVPFEELGIIQNIEPEDDEDIINQNNYDDMWKED